MSDDIIGDTLKRTNAIWRRFFGHHFACTMLTTFTFIRRLAELCLGATEEGSGICIHPVVCIYPISLPFNTEKMGERYLVCSS